MQLRINKYLASVGVAARRKIDEMIAEGKVMVNGKKAVLGLKIDPEKDEVRVNGKVITESTEKSHEGTENRTYIVLNKPKGVVSTVTDTHGRRTVVDLVGSDKRLYPVGRLDIESEGLMLLTNDGDLANKLMHPRYHIPKTYIVIVVGGIGPQKLYALRNGVRLTDGKTAPAEVEIVGKSERQTTLKIVLSEGRNRQIRRMAEKLHLHVAKLKRIQIGPIELGELGSGKSRELTSKEILSLKQAAAA